LAPPVESWLNTILIDRIAERIVINTVSFNQPGINTTLLDLVKFQLKYIPPINVKGSRIAAPMSIRLSPSDIRYITSDFGLFSPTKKLSRQEYITVKKVARIIITKRPTLGPPIITISRIKSLE